MNIRVTDRVTVIANTSEHGYALGHILTIIGSHQERYSVSDGITSRWVNKRDVELVGIDRMNIHGAFNETISLLLEQYIELVRTRAAITGKESEHYDRIVSITHKTLTAVKGIYEMYRYEASDRSQDKITKKV